MFYRKYEIGAKFEYSDFNAQLLGIMVERAVNKSLALYFEEKIWSKIGSKYDASWAIADRQLKMTKAYCWLNATAIDLAKFGRLLLQHGDWEGEQIIPESWVKKSIYPFQGSEYGHYSYMWWHTQTFEEIKDDEYLLQKDQNARYFKQYSRNDALTQGKLGNYIYILPEKEVIIVRLGKKKGGKKYPNGAKLDLDWGQIFYKIGMEIDSND